MSTTKRPLILAATDVESTGLDPFFHDAWEVAVVLRVDGKDTEHVFRIEPDLTNAEADALRINRYHERTGAPDWVWDDREAAARQLHQLLDGAVMIGSNPSFDAEMLTNLLGRYFATPRPWHYRTVDIATLAAGYRYGQRESGAYGGDFAFSRDLPSLPFSSRSLSRAVGVEPPGDGVAHTALGDARWAMSVFDAVTGGGL
ncbi:exonuclease domain-containing protein [Streptomyces sp. NPDC006655]|uniref:3'-5' exonuclease n=1 Tax=Streptomyces sp. NPDC006655 TaxID=3156898 RepID=UPI003453F434